MQAPAQLQGWEPKGAAHLQGWMPNGRLRLPSRAVIISECLARFWCRCAGAATVTVRGTELLPPSLGALRSDAPPAVPAAPAALPPPPPAELQTDAAPPLPAELAALATAASAAAHSSRALAGAAPCSSPAVPPPPSPPPPSPPPRGLKLGAATDSRAPAWALLLLVPAAGGAGGAVGVATWLLLALALKACSAIRAIFC